MINYVLPLAVEEYLLLIIIFSKYPLSNYLNYVINSKCNYGYVVKIYHSNLNLKTLWKEEHKIIWQILMEI